MVHEILRLAKRLDSKLEETLGRPYRAVLSVGLVISIIQQAHTLIDAPRSHTGIVSIAIGILFSFFLLINQMGELSTRLESRKQRRKDRKHPANHPPDRKLTDN